jgi:hypothetical protein
MFKIRVVLYGENDELVTYDEVEHEDLAEVVRLAGAKRLRMERAYFETTGADGNGIIGETRTVIWAPETATA